MLAGLGGNLDSPNNDGHTPAFAAASHGRPECLRALAVARADLARRDLPAGNTPAMVAASHGRTECLRYLVARAGRQLLSERNNDGLSAACLAVLCGKEQTLAAIAEMDPELLLDPGPKGWTAVHHAAAEGKLDCVKIMAMACARNETVLDRAPGIGGSIDSEDTVGADGASSLQYDPAGETFVGAEVGGDKVASSTLPLCGAEGNKRPPHPFEACLDEEGESPLHVATRAGHFEVFAFLVNEGGLRPESANARGENCLWIAAANGRVRLGLGFVTLVAGRETGSTLLSTSITSAGNVFGGGVVFLSVRCA